MIIIDVTIISNPTNLSNLVRGKSSTVQHCAIKQREEQKIKKYQGSDFVPLALEVYGIYSGKFELYL